MTCFTVRSIYTQDPKAHRNTRYSNGGRSFLYEASTSWNVASCDDFCVTIATVDYFDAYTNWITLCGYMTRWIMTHDTRDHLTLRFIIKPLDYYKL